MRVPATLLAFSICMFGSAAAAQSSPGASASKANPPSQCVQTRAHLAVERSTGPLTPRKLTELPPATAYMAVYRRIAGCDAPLTMAKYRRFRDQ
jgi:hypothetical protein